MTNSTIANIKRRIRQHLTCNNITFNINSYEINEYDVNPHISCKGTSEDGQTEYEIICYAEDMDIEMNHYYDGELYQTTSH